MKLHFRSRTIRFTALGLGFCVSPLFIFAADSASDLAAKLRAKEEGSTFVRMRMQIDSAEKKILQLQIKSRVSGESTDIVYQILFPKERKGEAVLLHRSGEKFTGTLFTPPNTVRPVASSQLNERLFDSDLSYEDIVDSPFAWNQQTILGAETIDGTSCQILESRPGKGHSSSYSSVKTWVDPRRVVPLRIEKYDGAGKVARRINATRILLDGTESIPANLSVHGPQGTTTEIDGSRIKRGVNYADTEFTPDGLKQLAAPPGSSE